MVYQKQWIPQPYAEGERADFAGTGWYVVVAVVAGLLLGVIAGLLLDRNELVTLAAVAAGSALAAWLMLRVGVSFSAPDPGPWRRPRRTGLRAAGPPRPVAQQSVAGLPDRLDGRPGDRPVRDLETQGLSGTPPGSLPSEPGPVRNTVLAVCPVHLPTRGSDVHEPAAHRPAHGSAAVRSAPRGAARRLGRGARAGRRRAAAACSAPDDLRRWPPQGADHRRRDRRTRRRRRRLRRLHVAHGHGPAAGRGAAGQHPRLRQHRPRPERQPEDRRAQDAAEVPRCRRVARRGGHQLGRRHPRVHLRTDPGRRGRLRGPRLRRRHQAVAR